MTIFLPKWIQDSTAVWTCTSNRIVHYRGQIRSVLERSVQAAEWNDHACRLQSARWPNVPAKPNTISVLILLYKFLICCHNAVTWKKTKMHNNAVCNSYWPNSVAKFTKHIMTTLQQFYDILHTYANVLIHKTSYGNFTTKILRSLLRVLWHSKLYNSNIIQQEKLPCIDL